MNLDQASTLVTGASRGLGRSLAIELARRGARVLLVARNAERLEGVVREIRATGGVAYGVPDDIAAKSAPHRIAEIAADRFGPIDLLVNNASTLGALPLADLVETACEDFAAVLEANLLGPFRLSKIVLGPMLLRGSGTIVNVSSDAAIAAYPQWGAYGVSKAALDHLTRVWAAETEGTGVRVLSVDPGEMDTQMHADALPDADRATLARPERVAQKVIDWIERRDVASGTRVAIEAAA